MHEPAVEFRNKILLIEIGRTTESTGIEVASSSLVFFMEENFIRSPCKAASYLYAQMAIHANAASKSSSASKIQEQGSSDLLTAHELYRLPPGFLLRLR